MRIAITGSNGLIGSELTQYFLSAGHEVVLLQRRQPDFIPSGAQHIPFDLNEAPHIPPLPELDAIIHAAYIPYSKGDPSASQKNRKSTLALFQYCVDKNIQFIFLSSLSAHEQALSEYGKHKYELEQKLDISRCLVLKLGLVIGKKGLFHRIQYSLKKSPIIFLVGGGQQPVQPLMVEDVVNVIARCLIEKRKGRFFLASAKIYSLKDIFSILARQTQRHPIFISIPYWLAEFGIRFIEILHLPFPVSHENLLGLKQLRPFDTQPDLDRLGVHLRVFEDYFR